MIREIQLGDSARKYAVSCLADGHRLSLHILERYRHATGDIVGLLPSTSLRELHEFSRGNQIPQKESRRYMASKILNYLRRDDDNCVVIEDPYAQIDDPRSEELRDAGKFYFGAEVYHCLSSIELGFEEIVKALQFCGGYPYIGVFANYPQHHAMCSGTSVSEDVLVELVERIEAVFIGAYDNETWLVWRRESRTQ